MPDIAWSLLFLLTLGIPGEGVPGDTCGACGQSLHDVLCSFSSFPQMLFIPPLQIFIFNDVEPFVGFVGFSQQILMKVWSCLVVETVDHRISTPDLT